jgi:hypothetical protein
MDTVRFSVLVKDDYNEASIIFEEGIDERELPEFLIHSDYFVKGMDSPENLWREAVAEAVTRFAEPKLVIRKKGVLLEMRFSFGKVKLRGEIPWEKAAKLFED